MGFLSDIIPAMRLPQNSLLAALLTLVLITAGIIIYRLSTNQLTPDVFTASTLTNNNTVGRHSKIESSSHPTVEISSDWPQEAPIPGGRIIASSGLALSMILDGPYDQVVQSLRTTYISRGFSEQPQGSLQFENASYIISIALENRDHSATSTNASLVLSTK